MADAADTAAIFPSAYVGRQDLVGRDGFVNELAERLRTGRNVVLMGPRRVGKTSIAREVLRQLRSQRVLTTYIDFFGITDKRQFAERMAEQLHEQRLKRRLREIRNQIPNFKPHVVFSEVELGLDISAREEDENRVFERALELPEKAAEKQKSRTVVCLDELQEAETNFGANVYKLMRSAFQQQPHTSHFFLGSQQSMLRHVFAASSAPFLRYADEMQLPAISADDWAEYVAAKFNQEKIGCSRQFATRIAVRTGCHPADTMVLCGCLYYRARALRAKTLDEELLQEALAEARAQLKTYFDALWSELNERPKERLVAARIARREPITTGLHQNVAARAINALLDKGVIVRTGRGSYEYFEPLFQEYVLGF